VGLSVLCWGIAVGWVLLFDVGALPAVAVPDPVAREDSDGLSALTIPDRIGKGETLSTVLQRNGFSAADVHGLAGALETVMEVRRLRPGDEVEIRYGAGDSLEAVLIHRGPTDVVRAAPSQSGWSASFLDVPTERRTVALAGVLRDNLFLSIGRLGESAALTIAFANVFAWDFDFHSQSREGDLFSMVVEKIYRDGTFVGYGDLKAARYVSYLSGERTLSAFLYQDPSGQRDYYDADGKSTRKAFLRAPLEFQRISSGFSYSRLHPVHNRRMPHLGVDYAAPEGTPVYSVASGVVTDRGHRGGGGNTVAIRHAMGYTTKYLHLSRFARGLAVGTRVEQKEVIGYVGATGTVTAAHLDFRLYRHGKPVNPLTQIFPPGPPVPEEFRSDFAVRQALLEQQLDAPRPGSEIALAVD
jgi:murein DD-endopeptidase MepM/ murein hydrolase activator NlpD